MKQSWSNILYGTYIHTHPDKSSTYLHISEPKTCQIQITSSSPETGELTNTFASRELNTQMVRTVADIDTYTEINTNIETEYHVVFVKREETTYWFSSPTVSKTQYQMIFRGNNLIACRIQKMSGYDKFVPIHSEDPFVPTQIDFFLEISDMKKIAEKEENPKFEYKPAPKRVPAMKSDWKF